jgi:serine protease Do
MAKQDFYALLGVDADASAAMLDEAYQQAGNALRALPDGHVEDVENRLKFLRFAYETLKHPARRAAYDATRTKATAVAATAGRRTAIRIALAAACLVGAGGLWFGIQEYRVRLHRAQMPPAARPRDPAPEMEDSAPVAQAPSHLSAEALFERNSLSVAVIVGLNGEGKGILQGSGVVIADQRVITNCHVAKSAASTVIRLGGKRYPATLLRIDADPEHDLCLLGAEDLHAPAIPLADVASVKVGQKVFALGAPKGLDLTLSEGIVSSLRSYGDSNFIQTTASISPGSSGGGLFNDSGALVGITTFQHSEGQNLNFAVPVDWVSKLLASNDTMVVLGADALNDLPGKWRCESSAGGEQVTYRFTSDGSFNMTRPEPTWRPLSGSYAISGNHTLVLKSPEADPSEVYVQILALDRRVLRISSPFYQDAQTYKCNKIES